jgi:von Willebrand factor type A domain
VRAITLKYFNENMDHGGKFGDTSNVNIIIDRQSGLVKVDATTNVDMTVMRTANFNSISVPVSSSVLSEQKDIELGMALDLTGSMGGQKIVDLRAAAKDLVDILMPDGGSPNTVRIGLAPYAASVNAGSYARTVTNNLSNKCVHERGGPDAFNDKAPGNGNWLGTRAGLSCPNSKIEPLTDNKAQLKSNIDTYTANGSTAGHIGAAWASYLISPEWGAIWPAASRPVAYSDGKTLKAIVLMTDGEFNTQYVNANGNSDSQARQICSETKNRDVVVYTIGFQSPAQAEALLKDCASSPETYFSAQNGNELRQAFVLIAQQLNSLRLTQ